MAKRKGAASQDYEVGYGRPPKATQFAKGASGNPAGRPKGSRTVGATLQDILQQKIAVTENGKSKRLPVFEVMLRRLVNEAMRSDPRAIKLLLSLVDRYGDSAETKVHLADLLAEDQAILALYGPPEGAPGAGAGNSFSIAANVAGSGDAGGGGDEACDNDF
jgi:hypothetical protein